ncbi:YncE family protein [Patescibacteria group bacterium]|nr:YncE family protein [Patescibacteria group bacterium]
MKTKIIAAIFVLTVLAGLIFLPSDKSKEAAKNSGTKIQDKIYVAVEGAGEIAVISVKDKTVIKKIDLSDEINGMKIGFMPHNVQVAPDNKTVWVTANANDKAMKMSFRFVPRAQADEGRGEKAGMKVNDEVIVIDPLTDKIIKRIEIGSDLHLSHVVLTPDFNYAIVASQAKGIIYKINAKTYEIEKEINTEKGGEPHGLRISPDGKTAYIAMLGGKSLGILDIGKMNLSYVPLKGAAVQTGVTPDGKYALASIYDAKSLAVYEIASGKLAYVDLPKEAKGPVQIYPTPDSRFVYVADQGYYFNQPAGNSIYKIDLQEMKVAETIKGGNAPHGVVVSQDGKFAYVTNLLSDDLSVIDADTGKEVARIKVGKTPNGVSLFYGEGLFVSKNNSEKDRLMIKETNLNLGNASKSEIVSRKGIHWHPELKVIIKGEAITIPANIGIGKQYADYPFYDPMMSMTDMHTHDASGTLHWEVMQGPVKKEEVRLSAFFATWGKKFDENCIFEFCNGKEGRVKMFVNGKENTEFQNYQVNNKDKIEIRYE